jgi:hypothetical protein
MYFIIKYNVFNKYIINVYYDSDKYLLKLELWVTSLGDTPSLQYYDVQTLAYRYVSKLIISPSKF